VGMGVNCIYLSRFPHPCSSGFDADRMGSDLTSSHGRKGIDVHDSRTTLNNLHQAPIPGVVVVAAYSDFVVPESQWVKKTGPAAG